MGWLALVGLGWAGDDPGLFVSQAGAVTVVPGGLLSSTIVEYRAPVMRYGGVAFNDTYLGAGGRLSASPAFVEGAARVSFQPIDLLPITVEAVHTQYWASPFGPLSYTRDQFRADAPTSGLVRAPRYQNGESFSAHMWSILVSPTLQMKVGPVVGFTNWATTWMKYVPHQDVSEPWLWEPFRGMVVAPEDVIIEHTSAVLYQGLDGEDGALLRLGVLSRGKYSLNTPDTSLQLGLAGQYKPDTKVSTPTVLVAIAPYLEDPDFVGPIPWFAVLATWEWDQGKDY